MTAQKLSLQASTLHKELQVTKKSRCGRGGQTQGRTYQLVFQCQRFSAGNIHTSNIIWTQEVIFMHIYLYKNTFMHAISLMKIEAMNLKESGWGYKRPWRERKERRNTIKF